MIKMKISQRERVIGVITLVICSIYIFIFVVIKPLKNTLLGLDERIEIGQERLDRAKQKLEGRGSLQGVMDSLAQEWGVASTDAAESSNIINTLEEAASKAGIRILNIEPRPVIRDTLIRYPIALTISGPSKNMIKFLYIIQRKPLGFNVEGLNMERAMDGNAVINGTLVVTRLRIIS